MARCLLRLSVALAACHLARAHQQGPPWSAAELVGRLEGGRESPAELMRLASGAPLMPELRADDSPERALSTHHARWMDSGKFQGDIAGVELELTALLHSEPAQADPAAGLFYNAIRSRHMLWPAGRIPYTLDRRYSARELRTLQGAFDEYTRRTCVRFVPRAAERDYLHIVKGYGCYSHVGRTRGRQELSLGFGCTHHEIAVHELMHAVGFWHEHSRADRDRSIVIKWHNIAPGMNGQFDKIRPDIQDLLGEPYDYLSVMHYDRRAYSRNGMDTIETVAPHFTERIGRAKRLSDIDVRKINKLYKCPQLNTGGTDPNGIGGTRPPVEPATARPVAPPQPNVITPQCADKFADCGQFAAYCFRVDFAAVMRAFCPRTCAAC